MKKTEAVVISRNIARFLNQYVPEQKTHSPHTRKGFEDTLGLYLDFLESSGVPPTQLKAEHFSVEMIEKWLKTLIEERGNKPETRNIRLSQLREFLKFLGREEPGFVYLYVEAKQIPRLRETKRKVEGMSREAVRTLLEMPNQWTKTGRRDTVLMTIMYSVAARVDEILSLKINDLELDDSKPYLRLRGKGNKLRTLYLLPQPVMLLKSYLKEFHGEHPEQDAYVFYSRNTGKYGKMTASAIDKMLKKYARAAQDSCSKVPIGLHAHQLRHAKATHWLEDGMNIVQISFLLGHEQIETTMKYLDITIQDEMKALATLTSETTVEEEKKWKKDPETLRELCGLKRRSTQK